MRTTATSNAMSRWRHGAAAIATRAVGAPRKRDGCFHQSVAPAEGDGPGRLAREAFEDAPGHRCSGRATEARLFHDDCDRRTADWSPGPWR